MFPNSSIPVIGVTGPTGAGKSTIAQQLASLGCAVIDGDVLAREITLPGSPTLKILASQFGEDILDADGNLNRALLAERAFCSEESRRALNRITHPAITTLAMQQAAGLPPATPAIALDAAALLESGLMPYIDHIVFAEASESLRLQRIMARDGISEEAATQRITAQQGIRYVPPAGLGHTILKSEESEVHRHELSQIMERLV